MYSWMGKKARISNCIQNLLRYEKIAYICIFYLYASIFKSTRVRREIEQMFQKFASTNKPNLYLKVVLLSFVKAFLESRLFSKLKIKNRFLAIDWLVFQWIEMKQWLVIKCVCLQEEEKLTNLDREINENKLKYQYVTLQDGRYLN
jgi:hypothetical protein